MSPGGVTVTATRCSALISSVGITAGSTTFVQLNGRSTSTFTLSSRRVPSLTISIVIVIGCPGWTTWYSCGARTSRRPLPRGTSSSFTKPTFNPAISSSVQVFVAWLARSLTRSAGTTSTKNGIGLSIGTSSVGRSGSEISRAALRECELSVKRICETRAFEPTSRKYRLICCGRFTTSRLNVFCEPEKSSNVRS